VNLTTALAKTATSARCAGFVLVTVVLAGCRREEISVYTAPKDAPPTMAQTETPGSTQAPTPATAPVADAPPQVGWKLPPGWKELGPDGISLQNFSVTGPDSNTAVVSLTRLSDLSGKDAMLVNMWRQQVRLPALGDDEAVKTIKPVQFGSGQGNYFEVLGKSDNGGSSWEIITGFLHTPQGSWFCKMVGEPGLVDSQKPVFLEFLKSIQFSESATAAPTTTTAAPAPNWSVPRQWIQQPAGEMQVAVFKVPDQNGAKAEVSVSMFPTEVGGTLANINRWRTKYVGLPEIGAQELPKVISQLDQKHPGSVLVDMKNDQKRLIGAIVPRDGNYWFYKINGDDAAVAPQKDSFIAFAESDP
jgi:hypothetical protein